MSNINENIRNDLKKDNTYSIIFLDSLTGTELSSSVLNVEDPYHVDLSQLRPSHFASLDQVYVLLADIIKYKQSLEGVTNDNVVSLSEEWNPEDLYNYPAGEVITIRLISREPARMSADGKSRPNFSRNFESKFKSPLAPNKVITVESVPKDHIIELSCWATTAKLANQRALWLENTLLEQEYQLALKGIQNWRYDQRLTDMVVKQSEMRIHQRPIRYFFRLYEPIVYADPQISNIQFRVTL